MLNIGHSSGEYRPEVDGLRGLAVGSVVLHHADPMLLPGGYVGVDVFFVISGYLITLKLAKDIDEGSFSFAQFYARRVKRLLPAAILVGCVVLALGAILLLPRDFKNLGVTTAAYMAMVGNIAFWARDGYFEAQSRQWPLLHTWSLAVEEQFYLVYPAVFLVASRINARLTVLCGMALLAFIWSVLRTWDHGADAYYLLPSRAWELLAGSILALLPSLRVGGLASTAIGAIAACMVVVPMRVFNEATPFPGVSAVLPVGGAALMIAAMTAEERTCRQVLSWWPLVMLGRVSYSLYLWHWPLIIYAKYPWSAAPQTCPRFAAWAACALSLPLAWLSYRYVETPGRRARLNDRKTLLLGGVASGILAATGVAIWILDGIPSRQPKRAQAFAAMINAAHGRQQEAMSLDAAGVRAGRVVTLGVRDPKSTPRFILWGDSHANALVPVVDELAEHYGVAGLCFCRASTPPVLNARFQSKAGHFIDHSFIEAVYARIKADPPECVVLAANWGGLLASRSSIAFEGLLEESPEGKAELLGRALSHTVDQLKSAGVKRIWIVRNAPEQPFNVPRQCALNVTYGRELPLGVSKEKFDKDARLSDAVLAETVSEHVNIVDLPKAIFTTTDGILTREGAPLYIDNNHLSEDGARVGSDALQSVFQSLADPPLCRDE